MRRHTLVVYLLLGAVWAMVVAWQAVEHQRLRQSVQETLLNRAHDVATSLAVVIRSQRRLGAVPRRGLVSALEDLARSRELLGIALLSPAGEVVAAGGQAIQGDLSDLAPGHHRRIGGHLVVAALVELGAESPSPGGPPPPEDPLPPPPGGPAGEPRGPSSPPPSGGPGRPVWTEADAEKAAAAILWDPEAWWEEPEPEAGSDEPAADADERSRRHARRDRWRQSHPFMQSPEKYRELYEKQGLHMMVLMLNDQPSQAVISRDGWLRLALLGVALAAAVGAAHAWRTLMRSTDLELRLARARAQNSYLRELTLAAAGLAHETRNPLNLVRGIAQMVASDTATPSPSRQQLDGAIEEVDRITARLNEFIDYAKPREPKPVAVSPVTIARDVARTLETDIEDKAIRFECPDNPALVLADPTLLRQVLFNLLLNATQAVPRQGGIAVRLQPGANGYDLEVVDNGPGIPPESRDEIFRPYVTFSARGTGLGLAVVQQIVLAHEWDIAYIPHPDGGSIFRIRRLKPAESPAT